MRAIVGFAMLALLVAGAIAGPTAAALPASGPGPQGSVCNPSSPSPAAVAIPLPNPHRGLAAGGSIVTSYEITVENYTAALNGTVVTVPTMEGVFPLAAGGSTLAVTPPTTVRITGSGWSTPVNHTKVVTSNLTFASGAKAFLTSQKIALMAPIAYGGISLGVRWQWTMVPPSGPVRASGWSVPATTATSPYLPSIFYPAPWVGLVLPGGGSAAAGTNVTLALNGSVTNTTFRVVVEYPNNGTEISSVWEPSGAAPTFNATASLRYGNGTPLAPGSYLLHVHDHCQAIVHSVSLKVTSSPIGGVPFRGSARGTAD